MKTEITAEKLAEIIIATFITTIVLLYDIYYKN